MFQFDVCDHSSLLKEVYTHVVQASKTYNLQCPLAQTQTQLTHNHKLHCLGVAVVDFEEPVKQTNISGAVYYLAPS